MTGTGPISLNPYARQMANFSNAYASTDPMEFYGSQMYIPFGGYGQFSDMYGMFGMMGWDPRKLYNPLNHSSVERGKNPYDALYFDGNSDAHRSAIASEDAIRTGLANLHTSAVSDNQDSFQKNFINLRNAVKRDLILREGYNPDDNNLNSIATDKINRLYQNATGQTLADTLRANGDGSFMQGLKDVPSLGIFNDRRTVFENINLVTNGGVGKEALNIEDKKQNAGRVIATAGVTAAGLAGIAKFGGTALKLGKHPVAALAILAAAVTATIVGCCGKKSDASV